MRWSPSASSSGTSSQLRGRREVQECGRERGRAAWLRGARRPHVSPAPASDGPRRPDEPLSLSGLPSRLLKRRDRCHQLTVVTRNPGSMTPRHPESTLDPSSWLLSTSNARVHTYCQISRALTSLQDSDGIRAGALSSDCMPNWYYGARLLLRHS